MREQSESPGLSTVLRWALAAAAVLVVVICGWLIVIERGQELRTVEARLESVARLKVKQIRAWCDERIADAAVLAEREALRRDARALIEDGGLDDASELLRRMRSVADHYGYHDLLLADPSGRVWLSLSGLDGGAEVPELVADLIENGSCQPILSPLHSGDIYPFPHISVVTPLIGSAADERPFAVLILVSDAEQFLYPLIQTWPVPTETAETLLVRRDGDYVLFLNDLRHREGAALTLQIPMSRRDLPAVMAVSGAHGTHDVVEGRDYRGEPVVAFTAAVPGTPWSLVSKMDRAEALASWRSRARWIVVLMVGATALIGVGGLAVHQSERRRYFWTRYREEARLRQAAEQARVTLEAIGDGVIATDGNGAIELMNPVAERLTGWQHEEAVGTPLDEVFRIINEETRTAVESPVRRVLDEGEVIGLANHTLLIRRDGLETPIADSGAPIPGPDGETAGVVLVFRDQTEERLNQRLVRSRLSLIEHSQRHSLDELLSRALDEIAGALASQIGVYRFLDADERSVTTEERFHRADLGDGASRAAELGRLDAWDDCVRQRRPVRINGPDDRSEPGTPFVRNLGVPVIRDGRVVAVLGVGGKDADYTDTDTATAVFLADVTWEILERKRAQEKLVERIAFHRALIEASPLPLFSLTPDGVVEFWNRAAERLFGWSADDVVGRLLPIVPEDKLEEFARLRQSVIEGEPFSGLEVTRRKRSGEPIDLRLFTAPVRGQTGEPIGIMAAAEDLTREREAAAELRESEERFRHLFEHSPVGISMTSLDGTVHANRAYYRMLGYDEAPDSLNWADITHPDDVEESREIVSALIAGERRTARFVKRYLHRSASVVWADVSVTLRRDSAGQPMYFMTAVLDITEQRALQAQLLQSQKMESIGRLAGGVAHDFNNMLGVIIGRAEMRLRQLEPEDPSRTTLETILSAASRSADLTRQLLAFARKQTIAPKVLDLNETVEGLLKMLRRLIGEDVHLVWQPGRTPRPVYMDPGQLDQILVNLCVNARDAIPGVGKITIETGYVELDAEYCAIHADARPGDYVLLAVSDDGCGMDAQTRAQVFEPFFTTKQEGEGTGLGLSTVFGIVRQNDGFINVYSEPAQGSTFRIYIPCRAADDVEGPEAPGSEMPRGNGEVVLLVEDEPSLLEMTQTVLEELGYAVIPGGDPEAALAAYAARETDVDLLVTDVVMPGMNGKELAQRLKANRPQLQVLFMSGYTANSIVHHGVLEPDVHFIQKPFSMYELALKVREVLQSDGA
jgi:PAS domain S-box-containing protein